MFVFTGTGRLPKLNHVFKGQTRRPCMGWMFRGAYCGRDECPAHHPSHDIARHSATDAAAIKRFVAYEPTVKLARSPGE